MTKIVKFYSIYYRFVLFIVILYLLGVHQIVGRGTQTVNIFDYAFSFHQTQLVYFLLLLLLLGIGIYFLFPWKFYITQDGIYLRRLALFVPWSDISGVSHVWINKASNFSNGINFYNNKCLVFIVMITSQFVSIIFLYWLYLLSNCVILRLKRISYRLVLLRVLISY